MVAVVKFTKKINAVFISYGFLLKKLTNLKDPLSLIHLDPLKRIRREMTIDPDLAFKELIYSYHLRGDFGWSEPIENSFVSNECFFEEVEHFE